VVAALARNLDHETFEAALERGATLADDEVVACAIATIERVLHTTVERAASLCHEVVERLSPTRPGQNPIQPL